jgi:hypothetical protein
MISNVSKLKIGSVKEFFPDLPRLDINRNLAQSGAGGTTSTEKKQTLFFFSENACVAIHLPPAEFDLILLVWPALTFHY